MGDLISREALKKEIKDVFDLAIHNGDIMLMSKSGIVARILAYIDNAPTVEVFTEEYVSGAYNEGYMCGSREAEKARPQGEYVDISKLRLMTVEECAGHTIEYAMGWKACIEWIKRGGAE